MMLESVPTHELDRMMIAITVAGATYEEALAKGGITDTPYRRETYAKLVEEIAEIAAAGQKVHIPGDVHWFDDEEPVTASAETDTLHMDPGPHPSGSPQSIHGAKRGGRLSHEMGKSGGFTYQPISNTTPKTGYVVAAFPERQYRISRADYVKDARGEINRYDLAHRSFIAEDPERHLGCWSGAESGDVFLDVVIIKATEAEGKKLGRDTDQYAIWDLERGEEIRLK
jgi:hypothetical protein